MELILVQRNLCWSITNVNSFNDLQTSLLTKAMYFEVEENNVFEVEEHRETRDSTNKSREF